MLVVVNCVECGKEYVLEDGEKLSDYQCECGGKMVYNEYSAQKTVKSKNPIKTITISILSIILIFFALFAMFNLGLIHVYSTGNQTNNSNNTTNNNTTPYIANQTYAANELTFNYPADWQPFTNLDSPGRWGYTNPIVAFYEPNSDGNEANVNTYFYIKQRSVGSLDEMLSSYRSDIAEIGQTEVSERNITVNGMRAVELIKTWHNDGKQYQALTVHIEAVPGSVYYRIGCVVPAEKYNATLPKFELVVNSFKPQ